MEIALQEGDCGFEIEDMAPFPLADVAGALIGGPDAWVDWQGIDCSRGTTLNVGGDESDCSWTHEEETGTFYIDMRRRVEDFLYDGNQTTLQTPVLSRHRRRCLHALAQTLQLGHASLGAHGRFRPMIIFKRDHSSPAVNSPTMPICHSQTASFESNLREADAIPSLDSSTKKRKRQRRVDGGFPCQFPSCTRVFDRASERTKHEQAHQSVFTNKYQCSQCDKGFRYPKDLKRHQRVHAKPVPIMDHIGTDSWNITSAMVFDSQAPSEPSWTFSSTSVSKDNSPLLGPQFGIDTLLPEMEPFKLDDETLFASNTLISMSTI